MKRMRNLTAGIAVLAMLSIPFSVPAQTRVVAPKNPYAVDKDVELGRQAAQEVERKLPLMADNSVQYYVERVGRRLAEAIPAEYQHPQFRYSYKVVDVRDVNAFALPGGFTYVNRGLIETAENEAQLAGVIAHEISHVALRHGTAQVAKAQKYQAGSVAAQILGAVIGGGAGQAVGALGQLGVGAAFLRFSREYERQADTLGAQIMANAGYDPRELANMFRILERQGGKGGPEWMSDHPNPGNRFEAINKEASMLRVENPVRDTADFQRVQARLKGMPRGRSMGEVARSNPGPGNDRYPDDRYPNDDRNLDPRRVEYPSTRFRTYTEGNLFRIAVPENWREVGNGNEVTFAPEGAYGNVQGQFVFTHGAQVGVTRAEGNNLQSATDRFLNTLGQGNRNLRQEG
ncbi:MAG TPA: M48 family metallopeptidase, partial [Blastocatellia bacterium]|nr:M48 family metallopeptidase [Blastocatellia bacterium]